MAGKTIAPPSKLAIEPDSADKAFGAGAGGAGQGKATKAGGKAEKSGGGKKGGKAHKKDVEEPDGSGLEKPVVAHFSGDGTVVGMWFRCVRDCQVWYPERNAAVTHHICRVAPAVMPISVPFRQKCRRVERFSKTQWNAFPRLQPFVLVS